eukprot:441232-Rhodomonas_salina.1
MGQRVVSDFGTRALAHRHVQTSAKLAGKQDKHATDTATLSRNNTDDSKAQAAHRSKPKRFHAEMLREKNLQIPPALQAGVIPATPLAPAANSSGPARHHHHHHSLVSAHGNMHPHLC